MSREAATTLRQHLVPLANLAWERALFDAIGDARIVLLGESSHGTREFYTLRAAITRRLLTEHGFDAVAVEADWPAALAVSRYVQGVAEPAAAGSDESDADPSEALAQWPGMATALAGFTRFPLWMWRNRQIADLLSWLRGHNATLPTSERVGFFGLDLYSLRESMAGVVDFLDRADPAAARQARERYGCLDRFADDPRRYGYAVRFNLDETCERGAVEQLMAMYTGRFDRLRDEGGDGDELFYAQQNARLVKNAERYYRSLFEGGDITWNLRDTHMVDTLAALDRHLSSRRGRPARLVVWAHNSHIGDARATEMGWHGQLNLGQLVRERWEREESFLLGFSTCEGEVMAAGAWDHPGTVKQVRPGAAGSFERLFHDTGAGDFLLPLTSPDEALADALGQRLERAIGVVYLPQSERMSHYFHAELAQQFDALIHVEHSHAVEPLDPAGVSQRAEPPDTYPSGT